MGRRASREIVMKLLYQLELQKEDRQEQIDLVLEQERLSSNDEKYIRDMIDGVYSNLDDIDSLIERGLKGWTLDRISKVELSVLRIALYEMKYRDDIPIKVSFNEAIELTKKYSGQDKASFVNGLLGRYISNDEYKGD